MFIMGQSARNGNENSITVVRIGFGGWSCYSRISIRCSKGKGKVSYLSNGTEEVTPSFFLPLKKQKKTF